MRVLEQHLNDGHKIMKVLPSTFSGNRPDCWSVFASRIFTIFIIYKWNHSLSLGIFWLLRIVFVNCYQVLYLNIHKNSEIVFLKCVGTNSNWTWIIYVTCKTLVSWIQVSKHRQNLSRVSSLHANQQIHMLEDENLKKINCYHIFDWILVSVIDIGEFDKFCLLIEWYCKPNFICVRKFQKVCDSLIVAYISCRRPVFDVWP